MVATSPIRQCAMALCFGAAALLGAMAWYGPRPPAVVRQWQPAPVGHLMLVMERSPVLALIQRTRLEIHLDRRQLEVYQGNTRLYQFPVAIGQDDWETPVGEFTVLDLRVDPVWQHPITQEAVPPGPDNPLGSRWIGFTRTEDGFWVGIHGTPAENLLGEAVSHGCVRMANRDIERIFAYLHVGTPIVVKP